MYKMEKLLNEIEFLRDKMIKTTLEKGFTCNESIAISQELDQLINTYHKTKEKDGKKPLSCKRKYHS